MVFEASSSKGFMQMSFSYVQSHFGKAVCVGVIIFLVYLFWPRGSQVNRPVVSGVALPGSYVNTDQRSTQVHVTEKSWELSFDALAGAFDGKPAYGGRFGVRYKF